MTEAQKGALSRLLAEAVPLIALLVALAISVAVIAGWPTEETIRGVGGTLQILGYTLVLIQLRNLLQDFERRGPIEAIGNWFVRLSGALKPPISGSVAAAFAETKVEATGQRVLVRAEQTIEARVAALERQADEDRDTFARRLGEQNTRLTQLSAQIAEEAQSRARSHTEVTRRITKVAVGDLWLVATGLVLSAVGTALQVWSPHIYGLL